MPSRVTTSFLSGPFMPRSPRVDRRVFLGQAENFIEELRSRGPIIPVQVGIPASLKAQLEAQGQSAPVPEEIPALIDTGASITAISIPTAERLQLPVTGSVQIGGATGVAQQPVYGAFLRVTDPFVEYDPIRLAGANLSGVPFQMLIGRDVLCKMLLAYDGKRGRFSLTF